MAENWVPKVERPAAAREPAVVEISEGWQARLLNKGAKRGLANCLIALRHAPEWCGVVAFDESACCTMLMKAPPWAGVGAYPRKWTETDDMRATEWAQLHGISCATPLTMAQAVQTHAADFPRHPIREYLEKVQAAWDGDHRIDTWLHDHLGVASSEYASAVGARWLIGAVARIFRPGCKNDCALILEGPQGLKKSTALRVLGEPWFTDHVDDIASKDSQLQIRGVWLVEWSELDALSRAEVSRVKAFMSRSVDRFRPPYGHRLVELPRESVFAGTTNGDAYLKDETGGRRFWPVRCGVIDIESLKRDRDQLWAEAVARFREGSIWWLDQPSLVQAAAAEQAERLEGGVWDGIIGPWIEGRESVSIDEVLGGCVSKSAAQWTETDRRTVGRALRAFGWERFRVGPRGSRAWRFRLGVHIPAGHRSDVDTDVDTVKP